MKIFCDLDGTLIDTSYRHYMVYSEVVSIFNGAPIDKDEYWALKRRKVKWPELLDLSNVSRELETSFLSYFIEKIESPSYLKFDKLFSGTIETLSKLSVVGECYLVSLRRNRQNLLDELRQLNIDIYFTEILSGHSENDGYDVKIELIKSKLNNDKGIIIGDTEADIVTGKEIGLTSIAVTSGIRNEVFLMKLNPDHLVSGIKDVISIVEKEL